MLILVSNAKDGALLSETVITRASCYVKHQSPSKRVQTGSTFPAYIVDYAVVRRNQVTIAMRSCDNHISSSAKQSG